METVVLFILLSGCTMFAPGLCREYYFVMAKKIWPEAQSYCRTYYTDLATIDSLEDMTRLTATVSPGFTDKAWIGLYDDLNSFKWSIIEPGFYGTGETQFRNWRSDPREPNDNGGNELCVEILLNGKWNDMPCQSLCQFVCYDRRKNASQSYVLVEQRKSFTEAQSYCRQFYTDLVSVRNETENQQVVKVLAGGSTWIGLYRSKVWSDGSNSSFLYWKKQPNLTGASCTTVDFSVSGQWTDEGCSLAQSFFCYSALTTTNVARTTEPTTTPQTAMEHTTCVGTTSEYVAGFTMRLSSQTTLTEAYIKDVVLQQIQDELIRRGLPGVIILRLRNVQEIKP
ncbi:macrophage mannose receptor 1-like isoform X2 [Hypomesus transpacificus]|uniref:macrophage mannose receptor 1-like isoform X2 n=1 Tax=Hypomesus transpacificus TaxID=137520 RepID=UPI001F0768B9|nr:macrophage mannose receptor 1-like isoform X2 [Hypomesus transpacificus]